MEYNSGSNRASNFKIRRARSARSIWNYAEHDYLPELYSTRSSYNNKISELKMSSNNFFWVKTSVALFLSFENCRKHWGSHQIARNWREKHAGIQLQLSSYKKFKSDTCNWTPTWSRADYVANRRPGNQSRSRILFWIQL